MPRTAVPLTELAPNAGTAPPTGTTVDVANGHEITLDTDERLLLDVNNTATGARNVTIKKGTAEHATLAGMAGADLVVTVPAGARRLIPVRESARFAQPGQKLWIDYATGTTGQITAYKLPA